MKLYLLYLLIVLSPLQIMAEEYKVNSNDGESLTLYHDPQLEQPCMQINCGESVKLEDFYGDNAKVSYKGEMGYMPRSALDKVDKTGMSGANYAKQDVGLFSKYWNWFSHTWIYSFFCGVGTFIKWIIIIFLVGIAIAFIKFIVLFMLSPFFVGLVGGGISYIALILLAKFHLFPDDWVWPTTKGAFWAFVVLWFIHNLLHIGEVWDDAQKDYSPRHSNQRVSTSEPEKCREDVYYDDYGNSHLLRRINDTNLWWDEKNRQWIGDAGTYKPWGWSL